MIFNLPSSCNVAIEPIAIMKIFSPIVKIVKKMDSSMFDLDIQSIAFTARIIYDFEMVFNNQFNMISKLYNIILIIYNHFLYQNKYILNHLLSILPILTEFSAAKTNHVVSICEYLRVCNISLCIEHYLRFQSRNYCIF